MQDTCDRNLENKAKLKKWIMKEVSCDVDGEKAQMKSKGRRSKL